MANIRNKSIETLEDWNAKELRKLRITIKNRIASLEAGPKPKPLPQGHPLQGFEKGDCEKLLREVLKAEKSL